MQKLRTILQSKYLFKILFILVLIYIFIFNNFITLKSKYDKNTNNFEVVIDKIVIDDKKINMTVKNNELFKLIYYYKSIEEVNHLNVGDTIKVIGTLEEPNTNGVFNTFDYKKYLYNHKIFYIIKASKITKIKNNTSLIYDIRNKINKKLQKASKSYSYLSAFILADKIYMDNNILNIYYNLGISHLFSISGMHISLITAFILYIINRISYNRYYNYLVVLSILIFYSIIIDFPPSVIRTMVMFILFTINDLFNLKIKSLDILLFTFFICMIINPLLINNIGFEFSYIISFTLIICSKRIRNIDNKILKSLYISYLCFLVSMPICIYNFYQINLIGIILNVIVIPLVSVIIFPLSILTFIFPFLDNLLYIFIQILEFISIYFNKIEVTKIILAKPHIFIIYIYYIAIILVIYNKKNFIYLLIILIVHTNISCFNNYINITFLDVGQGDSTFISLPHNKKSVLIDTGGISNSDYSIVENKTIVYLKSKGINHIDYLILTHGDFDHMGEAINLVNNFKVEKVIFNCGEFNELEQDLIKVLDKKKIPYYSCIKELNIDDNKLYFLNNKDYGNENDNSSVIYTELSNHKFLFMGDAGLEVEEDLIKKYNLKDIDVLKVGHHGSRTSSGKNFINEINTEYSIISVGKNNRYGHPNKEVLSNLEQSKIYRTDQDGSIMFKIKKNKLRIETYSP